MRRSSRPTPEPHPTTRYAMAVRDGTVIAGHWIRLAAQRHLDDLERGAARGLVFDEKAAARAIQFFPEFLRHADGRPFVLLGWQEFLVGSLFGWKRGTDRRFRHVFLEAAKGAGKSPLASGCALAALFLDEGRHSEMYCAAVTREQARIQFADCKQMVEASPTLLAHLEVTDANIAMRSTGSYIRPVSSEARGLDGKRVSVALIDELMEHPTPDVYEKMVAGTKAIRQPIVVLTTNAGYSKTTIAWQLHEYAVKILDGVVANDAWMALLFSLDPCPACRAAGHEQPAEACSSCDQWTDEAAWPKANPSLDTVLPRDYLRHQVEEALAMPSKQNIVKRLNFSIWTSTSARWLSAEAWAQCGRAPVDPAALMGRPCVAGLDLSETRDLSALVLAFPDTDDGYTVLPFFWLPAGGLDARVRRDRAPYDVWAREGHLELTEGDVVDYGVIGRRLRELGQRYAFQEIGFDPYKARQFTALLRAEGLPLVEVSQSYLQLSPPARALERLVLTGKLRHGGHPLLAWNAANAVVLTDSAGNVKPSKESDTARVDGIVALVIALSRASVPVEESYESVYDERARRGEPLLKTL